MEWQLPETVYHHFILIYNELKIQSPNQSIPASIKPHNIPLQ